MGDPCLILENAYFLAGDAAHTHASGSGNVHESRRGAKGAIDAVVRVVGGGTNVEPNHHHTHRVGGGSTPIRYQGGTVRVGLEVDDRA